MTRQKGSNVRGTPRANGGFSANVTARKGGEVVRAFVGRERNERIFPRE